MLALTRRIGEKLNLYLPDGRKIEIVVDDSPHGRVKLCIEAPKDVFILRAEIDPNETKRKGNSNGEID